MYKRQAIFWTLGYDTIYGFQDINDDEIIGVKSTSIKFKNNPKKFISFCYSIFVIWGAGVEIVAYSFLLILLGSPIFVMSKKMRVTHETI